MANTADCNLKYLKSGNIFNSNKRRKLQSSIYGGNDIFYFSEILPASWLSSYMLRQAKCSEAKNPPNITKTTDSSQLEKIFNKYASLKINDKKYMTKEDFVRKYLGLFCEENYNKESVRLLASAVDKRKDGFISFEEFQKFESILRNSDAIYLITFEIFRSNSSNKVNYDDFEKILRHTKPIADMDFNFDCNLIKKYFGLNKEKSIEYYSFCQLLQDIYEEQIQQAFQKFDDKSEGSISSADFQKIMKKIKGHLLTDFLKLNLNAIYDEDEKNDKVTYAFYSAFNNLLTKMDFIKYLFLKCSKGNYNFEMSVDDFLRETQYFTQITPLEIKILFHLVKLAHPTKSTISLKEIELINPNRQYASNITKLCPEMADGVHNDKNGKTKLLEVLYRFMLGSIAGIIGATAVYPIDLVKTRMQNQRYTFGTKINYKNSIDCFTKVIKNEGLFGLYRGLLPQVVGVSPEKAIKLTVNDTVRDLLTNDHEIRLWAEIVAGACAGACQDIFTNPLEIVKIRLQVAGEVKGAKVSVLTVLRELGFFGLYKGFKVCLMRDILFSSIYFPVYAHTKLALADENGNNNALSLFSAALFSGVPATAIVTPADFIKTRLQVTPGPGQTVYNGMFDCVRKIFREEGIQVFWKGTGARICRSAPQLAFTLLTYELLQKLFKFNIGGNRLHQSQKLSINKSKNADHIGGYKLAATTFCGIEQRFGLFMPKFEPKIK